MKFLRLIPAAALVFALGAAACSAGDVPSAPSAVSTETVSAPSASVVAGEPLELTSLLGGSVDDMIAVMGPAEDTGTIADSALWYRYDDGPWFTVADGRVTAVNMRYLGEEARSYTVYGIGAQATDAEIDALPWADGGPMLADGNRCQFRRNPAGKLVSGEVTFRPPVLAFPYSLGETAFLFADGSSLTVELRMVSGRLMRSADADYTAGGGINEDNNYIGRFELVSRRDGEELDVLPCFEDNGELIFHGPVVFEPYDYIGDGGLEFTLAQWATGSTNTYHLYRADSDGSLSLIQDGVGEGVEDTERFEPAEGGFYTRVIRGPGGSGNSQRWRWHEETRRFTEWGDPVPPEELAGG